MTPEAHAIESLLNIVDKNGVDMPFKLNSTQRKLDAALTGHDLIAKARQEGVSSYFLARYLIRCLGRKNRRAVVISHDRESTQRMLSRVHYFISTFRGPAPVISHASKNELVFPKTNSMFYIGTAGSRAFGRGDTITELHCSELAFWPKPELLCTGLFQAVPPTGELAMESTGNGVGNFFHRRAMGAATGKSKTRLHFFNWLDFPEYSHDLSPEAETAFLDSLDPDLEEDILYTDYGLSAKQLSWRREKLDELDYDLRRFKQEYPITLDECFQAAGSSVFFKVRYVPTKEWKRVDRELWALEDHPRKDRTYLIGADPAGGLEQDNSVAQVICLDSMEQVAEWTSNLRKPDDFGKMLADLGEHYNKAYIVVEANNHGLVTLDYLRHLYPEYRIYKSKLGSTLDCYGYLSSGIRKAVAISLLRKLLATELLIHSELLKAELSTFIETVEKKLEAQSGCLDDRVLAMAMAAVGLVDSVLNTEKTLLSYIKPAYNPFSLEGILAERKAPKFPIPDQHAIEISPGGSYG